MPMMRVRDISMYYEVRGAGEPLVLIPGLATDVSEYQGIIAALSQRSQVIALDNRGAGRTDKPDAPYAMELMAEDVAGLLVGLGIERAHLVGTSMGGRVALAFALAHPALVSSLILVSTAAKQPPPSWTRRMMIEVLPRVLGMHGSRANPQPYCAFARQREASRAYDCTRRLGEIVAPTLILHGRKDKTAPYRLAEELHAGIRGSHMVAFPGGHIFFFLRP